MLTKTFNVEILKCKGTNVSGYSLNVRGTWQRQVPKQCSDVLRLKNGCILNYERDRV